MASDSGLSRFPALFRLQDSLDWRSRAFEAHFTPCVEIGWRLAPEHWGFGYATEAAREVLNFAFVELRLGEVVSFTVPKNHRSRRVMERIGMTHNPADDFELPNQPEPWRHHILYRIGSNSRAG